MLPYLLLYINLLTKYLFYTIGLDRPLKWAQRFMQLKNGVSGISQKVLTDNLRSLEEDGIVLREVFAEVPPRVVYSLTPTGMSLLPVIDAMADWGESYKALLK